MSILDRVREKFQSPMSSTSKTSESPSAGSAGTPDRYLKSCEAPSAGSAGSVDAHSESHAPAPTLERRRAKVEKQLLSHPELRRAFDVADAPLKSGLGDPISVVLAVRHGEQILSGELHIPRERWDMALFLRTVDNPSEQPS